LFGMDGMDEFSSFGGGVVISRSVMGGSGGFGGAGGGGIPKIFNGGIFLSNKTPNDKLNYSFDYKANNSQNQNYNRSLIQDFLPGGTQFSTQVQNSDSRNLSHTFKTRFNWKLDSATTARLNIE